MNELVGAWVHGHANGHYGGSHDYWLVFGANGMGAYVYNGWWLYRLDAFWWHACSGTQTFRIVGPGNRYLDTTQGMGGSSSVSLGAGFHPYAIREGQRGSAPSLLVSLPGLPPFSEFLFQSRDPVVLSSYLGPSYWLLE